MSFLSLINSYDDAWKAVIMPPRQDYSLSNLGPTEFNSRNNRIQRLDFKLQNRRGYVIECSYYEQSYIEGAVPCVVYLHGSGCSRVEALQYMDLILCQPISLFTFDFTASGKSEGTYSSVGWFEQDDLDCVLKFLYGTGKVSKICLWGRSMGATTALLYSAKYPQIECLVLDSAFAHFKKLIKEIAKKKASIPGFLTGSAYNMIRKTIQAKANFDIEELKPIDHVDKIKLPALFGVGKDDDFVLPQHTKSLYEAYLGEKSLEIFDGDHNSLRPPQWLLAVQGFIKRHLLGPNVKTPNESPTGTPVKKQLSSMVQTHGKQQEEKSSSGLTSHSARKSNDNSPTKRVHPRSMQFSWLSNNNTGSQKHLLQPSKVENLTTIEDKLAKEKPAGSPQKKGLRARGHTATGATATATTASTVTNFSEASYRKDTSKIFTDSYFTSANGIKSEPDELDSEKGVIAHLGNGKGMIGPKLASTNPDDDKALSSREVARGRVGGGSEYMRSLSMSSKGWAASVIASEIHKINKATVGQTPIHDPSPKVFLKDASPGLSPGLTPVHDLNKTAVGQTPIHDPSPRIFLREVGQTQIHDPSPKTYLKEVTISQNPIHHDPSPKTYLNVGQNLIHHDPSPKTYLKEGTVIQNPIHHDSSPKTYLKEDPSFSYGVTKNNHAQNLASALNWLNPQPLPSYSGATNNHNNSFTATTTSYREPQIIPGHRKRGTNLSGTFLPGQFKLGLDDASPSNDYFPRGGHLEKFSSAAKSSLTSTLISNPTPSLGVTHNSAQAQPKVDLSPSYTYSNYGPNVYSPMNAGGAGGQKAHYSPINAGSGTGSQKIYSPINAGGTPTGTTMTSAAVHYNPHHQVTSPSVHVMRAYLGSPSADTSSFGAHKTSFTDATYKSYLNSNPSPYGLDYNHIQPKSYEDKSNSLLSYKDYEVTTGTTDATKLTTPGMYSYLPQSSYAYKGI